MGWDRLLAAATGERTASPSSLSAVLQWLATGWHWLFTLGAGGVALALIRFVPKLFDYYGAERQRRFEQRKRDRERLGPGLRELIAVGQELLGIASRLTNTPAQEYVAAVGPLAVSRQRLHAVLEPDLADLRDRFHEALTSVVQWRARVQGSYEDRQNQITPVDLHRLDRIDRHESEDPGQIRVVTSDAEMWLAKLEKPLGWW